MPQRVSVSFTHEQHELLSQLAEQKRVSLAWVIRNAVDALLAKQPKMLRRQQP